MAPPARLLLLMILQFWKILFDPFQQLKTLLIGQPVNRILCELPQFLSS